MIAKKLSRLTLLIGILDYIEERLENETGKIRNEFSFPDKSNNAEMIFNRKKLLTIQGELYEWYWECLKLFCKAY